MVLCTQLNAQRNTHKDMSEYGMHANPSHAKVIVLVSI
jgi:hypothetical protein